MLVGAVDIYTSHAVVVLGATAFPEVEHDDSAATADDRHVVVRTRGPAAPIRVSVWSRDMPRLGAVVFDGELDLTDHTLWVGDVDRLTSYTTRAPERAGVQRVVVRVDDPGHACLIHVGLDLDAEVGTLGPVLADRPPEVARDRAAGRYARAAPASPAG